MAKKALNVQDWHLEIDRGLDYRRQFGLEDLWSEVEALFYQVHRSQDQEAPNLIFSVGDSLLSSLNVPDPHITVGPKRMESIESAPVLESVDNALIEDMDMKDEVTRAEHHAFLWGSGFLKIGYDSEWGFDPKLDLGDEDTGSLGMTLSQFARSGDRIEFNSTVRPGMPWVQAVLPHDMIFPWGVIDIKNAPWAIHRVVRHLDDIKADPKYSNKRNLKASLTMEDFVHSYVQPHGHHGGGRHAHGGHGGHAGHGGGRHGGHGHHSMGVRSPSRATEFVELFEIHDRRTEKIMVIATGHDKFLRNDDDLLQLEGLPFTHISFVPRTRSIWTTPDSVYLRHAQAELTDISIQRTKQRRISVVRFLFEEGVISEDEMNKFMSSEVGIGVKVRSGTNPSQAVAMVQPPPNFGLAADAEEIRRDAREVVGFSRNQQGEFEGGRKTATEASIVQQASSTRLSKRQLAVRKIYKDTIKKVNEIIFRFWRAPQVTRVLGPDGVAKWVNFTGDGIRGVYKYDVDFIDKSQVAVRQQQALNLFALLRADPLTDVEGLRSLIVNAYNDPQITRALSGGQQSAELQLPVPGVQSGQPGSPPVEGG